MAMGLVFDLMSREGCAVRRARPGRVDSVHTNDVAHANAVAVARTEQLARRAENAKPPLLANEPPVVGRIVIEIRSDRSRTIARGMFEHGRDRTSLEAEAATPYRLALALARALFQSSPPAGSNAPAVLDTRSSTLRSQPRRRTTEEPSAARRKKDGRNSSPRSSHRR
jgi:hypothetical protein